MWGTPLLCPPQGPHCQGGCLWQCRTPCFGVSDASRTLVVAVGLSLQRDGHGVGVAREGVPHGEAGLPHSLGSSLGLSLWL